MQDELSIEKARVAILVEERNDLLRKVFELEEQVRRLTQRAPDAAVHCAHCCILCEHENCTETCHLCKRGAGNANRSTAR